MMSDADWPQRSQPLDALVVLSAISSGSHRLDVTHIVHSVTGRALARPTSDLGVSVGALAPH